MATLAHADLQELYLPLLVSWLEGSRGAEANVCGVLAAYVPSPPAPWTPGGHGAGGAWVPGTVDGRELWSAVGQDVLIWGRRTITLGRWDSCGWEKSRMRLAWCVPACWRALAAVGPSCLFPLPPWAFCLSWASLRSDELVLVSEPSRGRQTAVPPLLSRLSPALAEITPRPSRAAFEGWVGDLRTAGGGMGGGGRSGG